MNPAQSEPMVSVVIPAYNVTKTLQRLLDCLLNQDGSEDGTVLMAREAAEKDPRLTVVTQGNLGISYARNAGLALCEGKYIRFIDADDTLPLDSIERMVRRAEKGRNGQFFGLEVLL